MASARPSKGKKNRRNKTTELYQRQDLNEQFFEYCNSDEEVSNHRPEKKKTRKESPKRDLTPLHLNRPNERHFAYRESDKEVPVNLPRRKNQATKEPLKRDPSPTIPETNHTTQKPDAPAKYSVTANSRR